MFWAHSLVYHALARPKPEKLFFTPDKHRAAMFPAAYSYMGMFKRWHSSGEIERCTCIEVYCRNGKEEGRSE